MKQIIYCFLLICLNLQIISSFEIDQQLIGANPCTWGPTYWCRNLATARECNTIPYCRNNVWRRNTFATESDEIDQKRGQLIGGNPNTWGPSYWCKNQATCDESATDTEETDQQLTGANPCTWGPTYWCRNLATARECNTIPYCRNNVWRRNTFATDTDEIDQQRGRLVGANPCTWGPSYWCRNLQTIKECRAQSYCKNKSTSKVQYDTEEIDQQRLLGTKKCTWGPSYWCDNLQCAAECRASPFCVKKIWSQTTTFRDDSESCKSCTEIVKFLRHPSDRSCIESLNLFKPVLFSKFNSSSQPALLEAFDSVIESILTPKSVCRTLEMCTTSDKNNNDMLTPDENKKTTCENCEQIFSSLKDLLSDPLIQMKIQGEIYKLCELLVVPHQRHLCQKHLISCGFDTLLHLTPLIHQHLICKTLSLC